MGFNASTAPARPRRSLDFDFTWYEGAEGQPWAITGTVPEPSAARRDTYADEMGGGFGGAPAEVMAKGSAFGGARASLARLCNGSPPLEVLSEMPAPLFDAFRDWLQEQVFLPPTTPAPGSSAARVPASNGASLTASVAI